MKLNWTLSLARLLQKAAALPLAVALAWSGPTLAADTPSTPASAQAVAKAQAPGSKGVFWEIKSGPNTVYLFGSLHVAKPDFYPLPSRVEAAYQQAKVLAVEVDGNDPQIQQKLQPYFTYAAPDKLQNHLSPATWKQLTAVMGPAAEQMQGLKAPVVATALVLGYMQQDGCKPEAGIDLHFLNQAKRDGKRVLELESAEYQGQVLTSLNDEENDALLSSTITSLKSGEVRQEIATMIQAWRNGDVQGLAKLLRDASSKDKGSEKMMHALFDQRNGAMSDKIANLLASGNPALVVIGAGHMAGPNNVVELLQKKGMSVNLIQD